MVEGTTVQEASGINWIITTTFTFIFKSALMISLIRKLRCNKDLDSNRHKRSKYEWIVFGIFANDIMNQISFTVFLSIITSKSVFANEQEIRNDIPAFIAQTISSVFFVFTSCLTYLSLVYRIYETFDDTIYQINTLVIYIHIILVMICPILLILNLSIPSLNEYIMYMIYYFVFLFGATHLIYLFNRKLFLLVLQQRMTIVTEDIELSDMQLNMLVTLRKHTLLGCLMILFTLSLLLNGIMAKEFILKHLEHNGGSPGAWKWFIVSFWCWTICSNSITLCIYLGFTVNKKWYHCICIIGDRICERLCIQCTKAMINKSEDKSFYVLMSHSL